MPDRKEQELDIRITGSVDSSLAKALGVTEAQLAKLKDAVNTINKGFSKEAFSGAAEGLQKAEEKANSFKAVMGRVGEVMAGVFSAEMAMKFFDTALEGAKKLAEFMKESGVMGAQMEQMQAQLKIQMPEGTTARQIEDLTNSLQYFADTTPFQLSKVFDSFRELLVARVGVSGMDPKTGKYRSADVTQVMEVMREIGNIAAATTKPGESPSEHYAEIATIIQTSLLGGNLMERTLRPLEQRGVEVRPWLEAHYGLIPGALGKAGEMGPLGSEEDTAALAALYKKIKKGEVPAFDILTMLKDVTGKGGKYEGATEALSKTAIGGWSTLLDKFENIMRGIGKVELGPFEGIVNKINASFTPEAYTKVQDFFDKAAAKSQEWIDKVLAAWDKVDISKLTKSFTDLGTELAKAFGAGATVDQWQKTLQSLVDTLSSLIGLTKDIVSGFETFSHMIDRLDKWIDAHRIHWENAAAHTAVTPGDRLANAQRALSDATSDEAIAAAKKELAAAEAAMPKKAEGGVVTRATALIAGEAGPEAILPLAVLRDHPLVRLTEESIKIQGTEAEQTAKLTDTMGKLTETLATMQMTMAAGGMPGGGGFGLGSGYGGGGGMTEFGASVPGDQPGGPTYDWNSYHGIGAYTQHLIPGQDVAMHPAYAQGHYGIRPLDFYISDKDHMRHRWADVSGSANPANEDLYRGAFGGIFTRPTRALIGEAGPEALIPLSGGRGLVTLNYAPTIHGFGDVAGLLREHGDELLRQVEHALSSRFAAMAAV